MDTLPQPPPDSPGPELDESAPPLFEVALLSEAQWKYIWVTGVVLIVVIWIGYFPKTVIRTRGGGRSDQTEAVNNARQIGMALFEFRQEYGSFPDNGTIAEVQQKTGTDLKLGTTTSNDFFRQLMAGGMAPSESMFYSRIAGTHRPDNVFAGANALAKGECGFIYFTGATEGGNPNRPMAMTPMIPGTDRFDPKPFGGKAVILKADNTIRSYKIDDTGHILINGRNLMDPHHPVWEGHPPVIAWPE